MNRNLAFCMCVILGAVSSWSAPLSFTPSVTNQTLLEDFGTTNLPVTFEYNPTNGIPVITETITGSPSGLFTLSVNAGDGTNQTVQLTSVENLHGTNTVTLVAANSASAATNVFTVIVSPVNDEPTISLQIAPDPFPEDTSTNAVFTIDDVETAPSSLTITTNSLDTALIPLSGISWSLSDTNNLTVGIAPAANQFGTGTVQVVVSDGSLSATGEVTVVVTPVNDPPVISTPIPDLNDMKEDVSTNLTFNIYDVDNLLSVSNVTKASTNTTLFPLTSIVFGGSGSNLTVTLSPVTNENGYSEIELIVSDDEFSATNAFSVYAEPVNDTPTLSGVTNTFSLFDTITSTNLFGSVLIDDVDQDRPADEILTLTVTASPAIANSGGFESMTNGSLVVSGVPSKVQDVIQGLNISINENVIPNGSNEVITVTVRVEDVAGTFATNTTQITILPVNDVPTAVFEVNPGRINDDVPVVTPFDLDVTDLDPGEVLTVQLWADSVSLGELSPASPAFTGSVTAVENYINNEVEFYPVEDVITGLTNVSFTLTVSDGTTTITNTAILEILPANNPPSITGVSLDLIRTDNDTPVRPFQSVVIADSDLGGAEILTVTVSVDRPEYGYFSQNSFTNVAADVTAWIRTVQFIPTNTTIAVGDDETVTMTITADDSVDPVANSLTRVLLIGVDGVPQISINPPTQPRNVVPSESPFLGVEVSDTSGSSNLTLTIQMDNVSKGSLSNTVTGVDGFVTTNASLSAINTLLTNLVFVANDGYLFPPGQYGDTTFTITVVNEPGRLARKTHRIILQDRPRNILVTRSDDDDQPGSLRYAVAQAVHNDVITFAFTNDFPVIIRLAETLSLDRHLTFKGPGADKLILSGDVNGDGVPDTQLFRVESIVQMEGIALEHGTGLFGGAVSVGPTGGLTMRYCRISDSVALLWGGAIDVDEGWLMLENCLLHNNSTDAASGLGGGAVAIYTDQDCAMVNTTFSTNRQASVAGYGGGAVYIETVTPSTYLNVDAVHCTFTGNEDEAGTASSVFVNGFGSTLWPLNTVFSDGLGYNLNVAAGGEVLSLGGNISDDSTYTVYTQSGQPQSVWLLDVVDSDQTDTPVLLGDLVQLEGAIAVHPLQAGSPAIDAAEGLFTAVDQRGVIRDDAQPDSGAYEYGALQRIVINEIQTNDDPDDFIEFYIPRDSVVTDLSGYTLWINGINYLTFSGAVIKPGAGIIVAASTNVTAGGPPPTTVVIPPIHPLDLGEKGDIRLTTPDSKVVLEVSYNTSFMTISNVFDSLAYANHSVTLSPQFCGMAYIPHGLVGAGVSSAGYDTKPQAFGSPNASALAVDDRFVVGEDVLSWLNVLANDVDADRTDTLIVTGVPATNQAGVTAAGADYIVSTNLNLLPDGIWYNPLTASNIQQLAEGAELTEMLSYSIADMGAGSIALIELAGTSNLLHTVEDHRFITNDTVYLAGTGLYDGSATVLTVVDDDTVVLDIAVAGSVSNGTWSVLRTTDQADVMLTVIGANDAPIASNDTVQCGEEDVLRILADPAYLGLTNIVFTTDADYAPATVDLASINLLENDIDIDTDDDKTTLEVIGIVQGISELQAEVTIELRDSQVGTTIVYNPLASSILNGLAAGESTNDTFQYIVMDSHFGLGTGTVTVVVSGVNDLPVRMDDPNNLDVLRPFVTESNTVADVISDLTVLDAGSASSGTSGRTDARIVVGDMSEADSLILRDVWTTTEDEQLFITSSNVWANDMDVDLSDQLVITNVFTSQLGVPVFLTNGNQSVVYDAPESTMLNTLARGELVLDSFDVVISDGNSGLISNTVAVLVVGVNDTPIAEDDALDTLEDVRLTFDPTALHPSVADSDADINGIAPDNAFWIVPVSDARTLQDASLNISNNTVYYDPAASVGTNSLDGLSQTNSAVDEFTYTLTDQSFVFACDDIFRVEANATGTVLQVLINDRNYNERGGALTVSAVGLPGDGGTVEINTLSSALLYTPGVNFVGDEIFTYTITDPWGNIDRGRVTVRVTAERLNGNLQANDDQFSAALGEDTVLNVLANDHRLPLSGDQLSIVQLMTNSMVGTVQQVGNLLVYSNTNGAMTETFSYTVSAGGPAIATASVTIDVINRDNQLPVQDDCFSVLRDSINNNLDVLMNDVILPDSPGVFIQELSYDPQYGTAVVTNNVLRYTPENGFVGMDELGYVVSDGVGGTGYGAVRIFVGSLIAQNDTFTAVPDGVDVILDVLDNDTILPEVASGDLSITGISTNDLAIGTVSNAQSHLVFTSYPGSNGTVMLTYTVEDKSLSGGRTAQGTVTLTTGNAGTQANPDHFAVLTESAAVELNVLNNDEPVVAGRTLVITGIGSGADAPNQGGIVEPSAEGDSLIYTPAAGFTGEETFTYVMSDSLGTDAAKVVVQVRPSEIATCDDSFRVYFTGTNTPAFTLPVLMNDELLPDSGTLIITGIGINDPFNTNAPSQGGSVEISADSRSLAYRPDTNYSGAFPYDETFTYEVSDGTARRASAWVSVRVEKRTGDLVLETNDDNYSVGRNSSSNQLAVLLNDGILPANAAGWDITSVSACEYGGFAAVAGNVIIYTPSPNFTGTDTFTYYVSDGLGGTASADVTIIVGDILLNPDTFAVLSGTVSNEVPVLVNDGVLPGPEFDLTLHTTVSASLSGAVSVVSNSLFYAPNPANTNYPYFETLEYTVVDDSSLIMTQQVEVMVVETGSDRDEAIVTIVVQGVNDIPVITNSASAIETDDKTPVAPFPDMSVTDVDEWGEEKLTASVEVFEYPVKGSLTSLGAFTDEGGGFYTMQGTPTEVTAALQGLMYVPTENWIDIGTNELVSLLVSVKDDFSDAVSNQVDILVTPVNDPPVISGTVADQSVYHALTLRPMSGVTITEVDNLTLQSLDVQVAIDNAAHGSLESLSIFSEISAGVYTVTGVTAQAATDALRAMVFDPTTNGRLSTSNLTETTRFTITVDDRVAAPVVDDTTTVDATFALVQTQVSPWGSTENTEGFGFSVGAGRDWIAVGSPWINEIGVSGAVTIYGRNTGGPDQWDEVLTLLSPDATGNDEFGFSVAMSGEYLIVGAPGHNNTGAAYLFERNQGGADTWGLVTKLIGSATGTGDRFGTSVAMDADRVAVGAVNADFTGPNSGEVYLFERNVGGSNQWGQVQQIGPSDNAAASGFGQVVRLHGSRLAISAPQYSEIRPDGGAVYTLEYTGAVTGQWQHVQLLIGDESGENDAFGYSMDMYEDIVVVGSPIDANGNSGYGAAYIFTYTAATNNPWVQSLRVDRPLSTSGEMFGASVSVDQDLIAIGAPGVGNQQGDNVGEVYVYNRHEGGTNQWGLIDLLLPPDNAVKGEFGYALDLNQFTLGVTSFGDPGRAVYPGKLNVFRLKFDNAPAVADPIEDQYTTVAEWFILNVPDGTFTDPDWAEELSYSAVYTNGVPLLNTWLTFDTETRQFYGTPVVAERVDLHLIATDTDGQSVTNTFGIIVLPLSLLDPLEPMVQWKVEEYGTQVLSAPNADGMAWHDAADSDSDGLTTIAEYAFGTDPNVTTDASEHDLVLVEYNAPSNTVMVAYPRRTDDPSLEYILLISADLISWENAELDILSDTGTPIDSRMEWAEVLLDVAVEPACFYRIQVIY